MEQGKGFVNRASKSPRQKGEFIGTRAGPVSKNGRGTGKDENKGMSSITAREEKAAGADVYFRTTAGGCLTPPCFGKSHQENSKGPRATAEVKQNGGATSVSRGLARRRGN